MLRMTAQSAQVVEKELESVPSCPADSIEAVVALRKFLECTDGLMMVSCAVPHGKCGVCSKTVGGQRHRRVDNDVNRGFASNRNGTILGSNVSSIFKSSGIRSQ